MRWGVPCWQPHRLGEIEAFQSSFGITLPPDYLMYANGGHPELSTYVEPGRTPRESNWAVSRFYYLNHDRESVEGLWSAAEHWRTILGMWALPIAADGGGNQFFWT